MLMQGETTVGSSIFAGRYWWPTSLLNLPSLPGGVFRSTNNGRTWAPFGSGLPVNPQRAAGPQVYVLATHGSDIFAALNPVADYRVLYSSRITGNNWVNVGEGLPDETIFSLFIDDSDIFIEYYVALRSHVNLTIYDVLGRRVETLVDGEKSAGRYNVIFDASTLSSGVYFYRLEAGNFVQTKKLMVIK